MTKKKLIPINKPDCEVRPIPGFEGLYSVSESGEIWSHQKSMGVSLHGGKWLRPGLSRGYKQVALFKDKKQHNVAVHRALALAWIPNPNGFPNINHINGIKTDLRIVNLEWCTAAQNNAHAYRTGLKTKKRAFTEIQAKEIHARVQAGAKQKDIAEQFGVCKSVICSIANQKYLKEYRNAI